MLLHVPRKETQLFLSFSSRTRNPRIPSRIPPNLHILLLSFRLSISLRSLTSFKALFEISNDIIDMFGADGDADEILGDAGVDALGFGKLFVRCGPGVDGEGFGVADTVRGDKGLLVE